MGNTNEMMIEFDAVGENEGFARVVVAAFVSRLNPTLEELSDLKVAVSEAVTNAIIHGYDPKIKHAATTDREVGENTAAVTEQEAGETPAAVTDHDTVQLRVCIVDHTVTVQVKDHGCGITDVPQAMEPLFTTKPEEERSGMGFSFMEAFTDQLLVESEQGQGTCVTMVKTMGARDGQDD